MMSGFRKLKNYGKKGPGGFITLVITNDGDARGVVAEKSDPFGERGECTRGGWCTLPVPLDLSGNGESWRHFFEFFEVCATRWVETPPRKAGGAKSVAKNGGLAIWFSQIWV